jgi:lysophospholipid acyltransferase (LPLAT)-like uncharacterized protein
LSETSEITKPPRKRRRTPGWIKAFGRNETLRRGVCFLVASYIRLVHFTGRWSELRPELADPYLTGNKPFIYCFWHGRLLMMPYGWRTNMDLRMLISHHRDGAIIADTVAHFGLGTVRGSATKAGSGKNKGGVAALRAMVRAVKDGKAVGITPDGPSGPYMRASEGVVVLAKLTGIPILPATYSAKRRRIMNSWDRFCLPLPFSKGVIVWGEPLHVDRKASPEDLEDARLEIEARLNELNREADLLMGVTPVEPQPLIS